MQKIDGEEIPLAKSYNEINDNSANKKKNLNSESNSNPKLIEISVNPQKQIDIMKKKVKSNKKDVIENKVKSKISVIIYGMILSSNGLYFGFGLGIFNTFYKPFIEKIHGVLDENKQISIQGNLGLIYMIGGAICALTGSLIYEKMGRYRALILGYVLSIIIAFISLISNIYVLYLVRFFHGYIGCFYTFLCPLFVFETMIPKYNTVLTNSFYFFLTTGILISYSFGSEWSVDNWRVIFCFPIFIELPKLFIILIFYKIESPVYLYESYSKSDIDLQTIIERNYRYFYDKDIVQDVSKNFIAKRDKLAESSKKKVFFKDLFTKNYRLQLFMGFLLNFSNQITGINVLIFFSSKIYEQLNLENTQLLTFMFGLINVLASIFSIIFSGKIGKKLPYIIGLIFQGIGNLLFGFGAQYSKGSLVIFGGYLYMFAFGISCGALLYPYVSDFVPPIGIPFVALIQWVLAVLVVKFSVPLIRFFGELTIFLFFGIFAFICAFLVWGFGIETSDKSPHQIFVEFKNKKFGRNGTQINK